MVTNVGIVLVIFSYGLIVQIQSRLKHQVHMEIPCLRNLDFIIVDDPSYMSGRVMHGNWP